MNLKKMEKKAWNEKPHFCYTYVCKKKKQVPTKINGYPLHNINQMNKRHDTTNRINIWFLGMRTWSNRKTPLSIVLYAPFPNFVPISPTTMPGRGEWSSKLRNWTMKPGKSRYLAYDKDKPPKIIFQTCQKIPFIPWSFPSVIRRA